MTIQMTLTHLSFGSGQSEMICLVTTQKISHFIFWEWKVALKIRKEPFLQTPTVSSFLALALFSLGNSLFLTDLCNRWMRLFSSWPSVHPSQPRLSPPGLKQVMLQTLQMSCTVLAFPAPSQMQFAFWDAFPALLHWKIPSYSFKCTLHATSVKIFQIHLPT